MAPFSVLSAELSLARPPHAQLTKVLGDGSGEFDAPRLLEELPRELGLPQRRVTAAVEALTKDRKRTVLVQAISFLRQRKLADSVKALNNLLAANKARPPIPPSSTCAFTSEREWFVFMTSELGTD